MPIRTFIFQKNLKEHLTNCAICAILDVKAENLPDGFCKICIYFPLSGFDFYLFLELQLVRRTAVETQPVSLDYNEILGVVATRTPHGG